MNQAQKIDFTAMMLKPFVLTGTKEIKQVTKESVRHLVKTWHPAINLKTAK